LDILNKKLLPLLNERQKRILSAIEVKIIGKNGIAEVQKSMKISRNTIIAGMKEIESEANILDIKKIRKSGGGRKKLIEKSPKLEEDLKEIMESATRGDPEAVLLWSSKSLRNIEEALRERNYKISYRTIGTLLKKMGYFLQANRKKLEGKQHENRDAQFHYINEKSKKFMAKNCPVLSVDTKKKEIIGNFKNNGQEYGKKGEKIAVDTYDFCKEKAAPYGVYNVALNEGWVSVGISSDTAEFAVNSIRSWWENIGKKHYENSEEIYINADGGGSNGHRVRLWKYELQKLSNEINKSIHVSHFPPGTSKWNKIEHKMFAFISKNWRAKPLLTFQTVVNLIGNTRTKKGLKIEAILDEKFYAKGIKVSDEEFKSINLERDIFEGEWNYKISANNSKVSY
jgi:transposase